MHIEKSNKRNLLLITFDQFRGDWCDPDDPVVPLPNIENLAKDGWTFRRCYTSSPHCVPARLSWITGLYPSQLGVTYDLPIEIPPDAPSIIRPLRQSGWYTEVIGKTHWTSHSGYHDFRKEEHRIKALGFDSVMEIAGPRALRHLECKLTDDWRKAGLLEKYRDDMSKRYSSPKKAEAWQVRPTILPLELYPDIWLTNKALESIEKLPEDKPWLLWVSYIGPHEPFDTPSPWSGLHEDKDLRHPIPSPTWIKDLSENAILQKVQKKWRHQLSLVDMQACRRDYADHLRLLDDQMGLLLEGLRRRSDENNTSIIVTSDHGELLGDYGMLYKSCFLEGAVRVPWIYRPAPIESLEKGVQTAFPVGNNYLLKNCLDALQPEKTQANFNEWRSRQEEVYSEFSGELMMIKDFKKIILGQDGKPQWAIDLEKDPNEQHNIITSNPELWNSESWQEVRELAIKQFKITRSRKWKWRDLNKEARRLDKINRWTRWFKR